MLESTLIFCVTFGISWIWLKQNVTKYPRFLNMAQNGSICHEYSREYGKFLYKQLFPLNQPHCCLTFPWIELQMLLRRCLIHITIIMLRHILYLIRLCPCPVLDLFVSYLCDLLFNFSIIFIVINHI